MDILSHGLWPAAAYKLANKKLKKTFNLWLAFFWGVFPDIMAFSLLFSWLIFNSIFGGMDFSEMNPQDGIEPATGNTALIFSLTGILYNISHSIIIFFLLFGVACIIFRRVVWIMGGWLIHILIDIPTHSYQFYPTPFLWPLSDWKFNGFSWGKPWFILLNYSALAIVYFLLRKKD